MGVFYTLFYAAMMLGPVVGGGWPIGRHRRGRAGPRRADGSGLPAT